MADVKAVSTPEKPKVLSIRTGEGGVELPGIGSVRSYLGLTEPWATSHKLEMHLDRALGGVVIRYVARGKEGKDVTHCLLVPMTHLRKLELEAT